MYHALRACCNKTNPGYKKRLSEKRQNTTIGRSFAISFYWSTERQTIHSFYILFVPFNLSERMSFIEYIICPLCKDTVDKLVYRFHHDSERIVIEKTKQEFPEWTVNDGACSRCVDFFHAEIVIKQKILPAIGPHSRDRE